MANIIEQQDLLKGLPDARLSLLLQKPDASIPPFLVAAEAQRRQAIRQQFAGNAGKESVVDTLTKQLSNVPQNIKAPMQTPPNIPPPQMPQQMAGIGALPQDQQGMAGGGAVRRFDTGSLVTPTVDSMSNDYFTDPLSTPSTADSPAPGFSVGDVVSGIGSYFADGLQNLKHSPLPRWQTEEDANKRFAEENPTGMTDAESQSEIGVLSNRLPNKPASPTKKPSSTAGTSDTSPANKYKAMEADMRKRLEGLYAADEPSNWEDAQKWFAMSQQIMNPDATLMQGLVNAGAVYAGAEGEQAAQARDAARSKEQAMLNWDMQIMQSDRAAEAAAAEKADQRAYDEIKRGKLSADDAATSLNKLIDDVDKQISDGEKDPLNPMDPKEKERLVKQRNAYAAQLSIIMKNSGFGANGVVTLDDINALGIGAQ